MDYIRLSVVKLWYMKYCTIQVDLSRCFLYQTLCMSWLSPFPVDVDRHTSPAAVQMIGNVSLIGCK
jgi:hypothetical protein